MHALQHVVQLLIAHQTQQGSIDARAVGIVGSVVVSLDSAQRPLRLAGGWYAIVSVWVLAGQTSHTVLLRVVVPALRSVAALEGRLWYLEGLWFGPVQLEKGENKHADGGSGQDTHGSGQRHSHWRQGSKGASSVPRWIRWKEASQPGQRQGRREDRGQTSKQRPLDDFEHATMHAWL